MAKTRKKSKKSKRKKRVYTQKNFNSNDGMLTSVWGPSLWHVLHCMSFNYPVDQSSAVVEYLDTQELESCKIALSSLKRDEYLKNYVTHTEIHHSFLLSIMANQIIFPENNQFPRDLFSCGQSKQAASLYSSNFHNRIDKTGIILNYGQIPLTKSRYLKYASNEEHPYGENAIVAVMCLNGYNTEDAILINESALQRGLFRTTYYNMYEAHEETSKFGASKIDSKFMNIQNNPVVGQKPGYDYGLLDENGLIDRDNKDLLVLSYILYLQTLFLLQVQV